MPSNKPSASSTRAGLTSVEHKERREWLFKWKLGAAVTIGVRVLAALLKRVTG